MTRDYLVDMKPDFESGGLSEKQQLTSSLSKTNHRRRLRSQIVLAADGIF